MKKKERGSDMNKKKNNNKNECRPKRAHKTNTQKLTKYSLLFPSISR